MGLFDGLIKKNKNGEIEIIELTISPEMIYKRMAINNAVGLIANAICGCEFVVYKDGEKKYNEDYYKFNVSPNPNQNASEFWHKVITKMLGETGEALCFETNQGLFCADSFSIKEQRDLLGHKYHCVQIGNMQLRKTFESKDVFLFKLESEPIKNFIDAYYKDVSKLLKTASDSFKKSKGTRFKLKVKGLKAGDEKFVEIYTKIISKQIQTYVENDNGVFPEFEGFELVQDNTTNGATVGDFLSIKKDIFEQASLAFKIPLELMTGASRTVSEVVKQFMTFGVKPYIRMIEQAINKTCGYELWDKGCYVKIISSGIVYHDPIDEAQNVDKLISTGFYCLDEARLKFSEDELNTDFSETHWITKNYDSATNVLKGGES